MLEKLGPFDLDPCAPVKRPWPMAAKHYTIQDDGLSQPWTGRAWVNAPYGPQTGQWLERLADHGNGLAIIFARTETEMFHRWGWERADAILFLRGRIHFYTVDGERAKANAGGPSVLLAYGRENVECLVSRGLVGQMVFLSGGVGYGRGAAVRRPGRPAIITSGSATRARA